MDHHSKMMGKRPFEYYIFKLEKDSIIPAENGAKKNQRFRCDICSAIFKRGFSLKRHYLRFHINVIYINERDLANCGITPAETTETGLYKCHDCSTHFEIKDELMEHRNSYHVNGRKPGLNYFCDRCSMTFTNKHNFLSHVKRACQKEDVKICPHCQKEYARKGRLEKHMQHCKNDCKKSPKTQEELLALKAVGRQLLPQSLTNDDTNDEESKSVYDSGDESDNSRSSLVNDFHSLQTYPDFKIEQESTDGLFDGQFDFSQTVERYVREEDDKVYLVLDTARAIYPSDRPYDDPNYYDADYPFNLEEITEEEKPQDDSVDESVLTWQELKFSADSDSQDVFIRVRATYVDRSDGQLIVPEPIGMPGLKTYASKSLIKQNNATVKDLPSLNSEDSLDSCTLDATKKGFRVNGCADETKKPKIVLDKLMTLIKGTGVFDAVPSSNQEILGVVGDVVQQEYSADMSRRSIENGLPQDWSLGEAGSAGIKREMIALVELGTIGNSGSCQGEPQSKKLKLEEEGRKSHLFRSKHTCPECGKSFGKPGKMVSHRRLAHGSQGVKTKIDSFNKFHYLPLWSPRRDDSTEPPPERLLNPFSLDFVNSCCEDNINLFVDGKLMDFDASEERIESDYRRLSWKHHTYLQKMSDVERNQFLSDMVKFPLAEQFHVHSKISSITSRDELPIVFFSSLGLNKAELNVPEPEPLVFEGMWSKPKCFVCRTCGMRSKDWHTYDTHRTYSHPLVFCSHVVLEMKSVEVPRELWSEWALGYKLLRGSSKKRRRRRVKSLATAAAATSTDLNVPESAEDMPLRRLRSSSALVMTKRGKAETPRSCTKCKKRGMTLAELHNHILECGGKKENLSSVRSTPGSKKKQHRTLKGRHGMKRKIPSHQETPKKKSRKKKDDIDVTLPSEDLPNRRVLRPKPAVAVVREPEFQSSTDPEILKDLTLRGLTDNTKPNRIRKNSQFEVETRKGGTVLVLRKKLTRATRNSRAGEKQKGRTNQNWRENPEPEEEELDNFKTEIDTEVTAQDPQTPPSSSTRVSSNRSKLSRADNFTFTPPNTDQGGPIAVKTRLASFLKTKAEAKACDSIKRNILAELSSPGCSAFTPVTMDFTKTKKCPRCLKQFRYTVALKKHYDKCLSKGVKAETVEVTISSGQSSSFRAIDESSEYIDLDTALELADARTEPNSKFSGSPQRFEQSDDEDSVRSSRFQLCESIPNSRLPVLPASKSLRNISYEERVALGRRLEQILQSGRRDDENFDLQMLTILHSSKERSSYLALACPTCLRKYKYKAKFKQHVIEGLIYGCIKRKVDDARLSTDAEAELDTPFLYNVFAESQDTCKRCEKYPSTHPAHYSHMLAHSILRTLKTPTESLCTTWIASKIGESPSLKELEFLLKKCTRSDLAPLCSDDQLRPLVNLFLAEKLLISDRSKNRKHLEVSSARPKSAPLLRSYRRKQAEEIENTQVVDQVPNEELLVSDPLHAPLLQSHRRKQAPPLAVLEPPAEQIENTQVVDRVLNEEVSAIMLQQTYLKESPLHHPDIYGGSRQRAASAPLWDNDREWTDEYIVSQLAPLDVPGTWNQFKDTSGDSGYATCNNSSDQFQLLHFRSEPTVNDLCAMPLLPLEGPFSECRFDEENGNLPLVSDSPPALESYATAVHSTGDVMTTDINYISPCSNDIASILY